MLPEQEYDERIHLRDRGIGRDLGRNPLFDGRKPTTRSDNHTLNSVGDSFGNNTDKITSWFANPVPFQMYPGLAQTVVNGASVLYGITCSYTTRENYATVPMTPAYGTGGAGYVDTYNGLSTLTVTTVPTGGDVAFYGPSIPVTSGQLLSFNLTAWQRGANFSAVINWRDVGNAWVGDSQGVALTSSPTTIEIVGFPPVGAASGRLYIRKGFSSVAVGDQLNIQSPTRSTYAPPSAGALVTVATGTRTIATVAVTPTTPVNLAFPTGINANSISVTTDTLDTILSSNCSLWVGRTE